jgi:cyclase
MEKLSPYVYVESGYRGCTVGAILTPEGVICVDAPLLPADARHWRGQLAQLTDKPISYVIYTDGHRDRVIGQQYLGGMVVAHEQTFEKMRSFGDAFRQQVVEFLAHHGAPQAAEEISHTLQLALPQITIANGGLLTLHINKPKVVVRPVGGATPGSVWVELPDQNIAFVGDLVTLNTHPFMSEANTLLWLQRLTELRDKKYFATKIVPGRGGVYRKQDAQKVADYLTDMRTQLNKLMTKHRGKIDVGELLPDFLDRFPVPHGELERVQRRIRTGLERVHEELRVENRKNRR